MARKLCVGPARVFVCAHVNEVSRPEEQLVVGEILPSEAVYAVAWPRHKEHRCFVPDAEIRPVSFPFRYTRKEIAN